MNNNNVEKQYNSMSYFYNVLYSVCDMMEFEKAFIEEYKDLFESLPQNGKVLDSSCGNGVQATALKRIDKEDMLNNIKSLSRVTKNRGKLVFDTRNWDKVLKDNVRFTTSDVITYNGKKYIYTYIGNLNGFDERSSVEILFVEITNDKRNEMYSY